jgi:hypothetical protein
LKIKRNDLWSLYAGTVHTDPDVNQKTSLQIANNVAAAGMRHYGANAWAGGAEKVSGLYDASVAAGL